MQKLFWMLLLAMVWSTPSWVCAQTADLATAQKQYGKYCVKCHGDSGRGDGEQSATLHHKPKDWNDCTEMAKISDEDHFKIIKFGGQPIEGQRSDMKGMGKVLKDEEIHGLVAYARSFCPPQKTTERKNLP